MIPVTISVQAKSEVELPEISSGFSELNSTGQATFLMDIFDALKHRCKDEIKYQSQLHWIATEINRYNFVELKETIRTLNEYLKDKT
jgi:hypothetical protein